MPSGEVFTGPLEDSANGTIRFTIPSSPARAWRSTGVQPDVRGRGGRRGQRASGARSISRRRWRPTRARASSASSGSGPTPGIDRPTGSILLDEKMAGTVHLALGRSYPETGGTNQSGAALGHDLRPARRRPAQRRRRDPAAHGSLTSTQLAGRSSFKGNMRRTKIVATIGPASRDPETLTRMVEAGLDVARLNFSHGNREIHAENAERVRAAADRGRPPGRDPAGPAGPEAPDRRARGRHRRAQARREADARLRLRRRRRRASGCRSAGAGWPARWIPTTSSTWPTARSGCA